MAAIQQTKETVRFIFSERSSEAPPELFGAPQKRRPTALNLFIGVSTNENTGRESEAPAELFRPRDRPQVLVDAKWPPNNVPQERRSAVMMDRTIKRSLQRWRRPRVLARESSADFGEIGLQKIDFSEIDARRSIGDNEDAC